MAAPMPHVGKLFCRYIYHVSRNDFTRYQFTKTFNVYSLSYISKYSSKSNEKANDFYGISEENSVTEVQSLPKHELHKKYAFKDVNERDTGMTFGSVRVEESIKRSLTKRTSKKRSNSKYASKQAVDNDIQNTKIYQSSPRENNFFDEQYFGSDLEPKDKYARPQDENVNETTSHVRDIYERSSTDSMNFVDRQYFYRINEPDTPTIMNKTNGSNLTNLEMGNTTRRSVDNKYEDLNYVDKQYFDTEDNNNQEPVDYFKQQTLQKTRFRSAIPSHDEHQNSKSKKAAHKDGETTKSAYEVAMEMRKNLKTPQSEESQRNERPQLYPGPVDSKGFRILRNQVADIMNTPSAMVTKLLRDNIIYNRGDVIAIEKPYGLPSHGGPGVHMSVAHLLPDLARLVDPSGHLDTLHMVHRLDRQTTGVMLLAKTSETAWRLHRAFRKREVVKKYWVLTKGVPSPEEGVVDIPMAEGTVGRYHRMVLKPEITDETRRIMRKSSVETFEAVTQYRVLASHGPAALVECTPTTGVKHQIRVHLAFGLNTPVLGDHKYSHITKVAPQRLHPDLLERLGIRQSKVRHLPMMLHAKSLLLPEFQDGRNIFISCRLPQHFRINMNRLKIKPPKTD